MAPHISSVTVIRMCGLCVVALMRGRKMWMQVCPGINWDSHKEAQKAQKKSILCLLRFFVAIKTLC
jgi:hypothetical protein